TQLVLALDLKSGKSRELLFMPNMTMAHPGSDEAQLAMVVSPNGKLAAVAVEPRGSRIAWLDLTGEKKPRLSGAVHRVRGPVAWSKDGNSIAWRTRGQKDMTNTLNLKTLTYRSGPVKGGEFRKGMWERGEWKVERVSSPGKYHLQISRKGKPAAQTPTMDR